MFRRDILGLWLSSTLIPSVALAHGPTRQKVTETVEINAFPDKVWAAIGDFGDMSWHPAVARTDAQGGNTVDARRVLTLRDGGTTDEVLYKYDQAGMTYSYRITRVDVAVLPVTNYSSTLSVKPADGGRSLVEWRGAFYRGYPNYDPPPNLNDAAAVKAVSAMYRAGLDHLRKTLEGES